MISPSQRLHKKLQSFQQKYNDKENISPNKVQKPNKMQVLQPANVSLFLKGIDNFAYKKEDQQEETEVESDYKDKSVTSLFNNYWQVRTNKFNQQIGDFGIYSDMEFLKHGKTLQNEKVIPIFEKLTFYFNGRFEVDSTLQQDTQRRNHYPADMYTHYHLCHIVKLHGATVLPYLAKKQITHVICNHFSAAKQLRVNESLSKTRANEAKVFYVQADWIFACIKEGKLIAEDKYIVDTTGNYFSLESFFEIKNLK